VLRRHYLLNDEREEADLDVSGVRPAGGLSQTYHRRVSCIDCIHYFLPGFRHLGNTQETNRFLGVKPIGNPSKKTAPNVIQFQLVMPVVIKNFFTFTASNDE